MSIIIENSAVNGRIRTQTPTAYLKSEYGGKKIAEIFAIPLSSLKVFPGFNKRVDYDLDELKTFIKQNGISFPALRLMYIEGELYIDEGHRRHAACIELNMDGNTLIPVYVGESSSPEERLARQVTSNSGKNYNFIELVSVAKELIQRYRLDQNGVSNLIGKSQGAVSQMTKFFGYSQLMYAAINANDIKYTRVLELHKRGLSETDILDIIAKEKHDKQDKNVPVESDVVDTVVEKELHELTESEQFMSLVNYGTSVPPTNDVVDTNIDAVHAENSEVHSTLDNSEKIKLSEILADKVSKARVVKSAGQAIKASNIGLSSKKANPAKLIAQFMSCAEIIDNGDGTVSYKVSKAESDAFDRGANNM